LSERTPDPSGETAPANTTKSAFADSEPEDCTLSESPKGDFVLLLPRFEPPGPQS